MKTMMRILPAFALAIGLTMLAAGALAAPSAANAATFATSATAATGRMP